MTNKNKGNEYAEELSKKVGCSVEFDSNDIAKAFDAGYECAIQSMIKNGNDACERMSKDESDRELKYITEFTKKNHRVPTFSDCIEYTREVMINKAAKVYSDLLSAQGYDILSVNAEVIRMQKVLNNE